jgi:hypothetical protein
MALKQCPECKGEVSEKATRCPHCGFKDPRTGEKVFWTFLILFVCAVAVVVIMGVVETQKANRAEAEFHAIADPALTAYRRIYSSPTPTQPKASPSHPAPAVETTPSWKPADKATAEAKPPPFVTLTQSGLPC